MRARHQVRTRQEKRENVLRMRMMLPQRKEALGESGRLEFGFGEGLVTVGLPQHLVDK
jgi:hypothetical protein